MAEEQGLNMMMKGDRPERLTKTSNLDTFDVRDLAALEKVEGVDDTTKCFSQSTIKNTVLWQGIC
ncbi:hypothetical protein N7486_000225 [Penicillium sp. IBT 16267x]|nr:hypothetical protein N7486_000225 [Penicillium sp. IBT 16267x]